MHESTTINAVVKMAKKLAFNRYKETDEYKQCEMRRQITLNDIVGPEVLDAVHPSVLRRIWISEPVEVIDTNLTYPRRNSSVPEAARFLRAYGILGRDYAIGVMKSSWVDSLRNQALHDRALLVQVTAIDLWAGDMSNVGQKLKEVGGRLSRCSDWSGVPHRLKMELRRWLPFRYHEHYPLLAEVMKPVEKVIREAVAPEFTFGFLGNMLKLEAERECVRLLRAAGSGWEIDDSVLRSWPTASWSDQAVMLDALIAVRAWRMAPPRQ